MIVKDLIKNISKVPLIFCTILLNSVNEISQIYASRNCQQTHYRINTSEYMDTVPYTIKVNVSLTKTVDILLYHDLILRVSQSPFLKFTVILSNFIEDVEMSKLCKCWICKYTPLALSVTVNKTTVTVQCNNADLQSFDILAPETISETSCSKTSHHEMLIFKYDENNKTSNRGCIHKVWLNNNEVFRETQSTWKCVKICHKNTCNGGKCYEQYNGKTFCDCAYTFRNGEFCNSSMPLSRSPSNKISDETVRNWKFSFITKSEDIIQFENENAIFLIKFKAFKLYLEIRMKDNKNNSTKKYILSNKYESNKNSILILKIEERNLLIEFLTVNGIHNKTKVSGILLDGFSSLNYSEGMNVAYIKLEGVFMEIVNNLSASDNTSKEKEQIYQQVGSFTKETIIGDYMKEIIISIFILMFGILIIVGIKCHMNIPRRRRNETYNITQTVNERFLEVIQPV